jgi:hybrid cluster-associated redox disulfide protein
MNASLTKDWTIQNFLQACPKAAQVFIRYKTDCIGCRLERFCTLEDVSSSYKLDVEDFLNALQIAALMPIQRSNP